MKSVALLALAVVACITAPTHGKKFKLTDEKGAVCAEMDAEFSIHFSLLQGIQIVDQVDLTEDFATISVDGNCNDTLVLQFGSDRAISWEWDLISANTSTGKAFAYQRTVQFQPEAVFGTEDPDYDHLTFITFDDPILPDQESSYLCSEEKTFFYIKFNAPVRPLRFSQRGAIEYEYGVSVTVSDIQVQVGNMKDGKFGPGVQC